MLVVLELRRPDGSELLSVPLAEPTGAAGARLDSNTCDEFLPPELLQGDEFCARIVAYDGSGNSAGESAERCAAVQRCFSECDSIPSERGVCPEPPDDLVGPATGNGGCAVRPSSSPLGPFPPALVALTFAFALKPKSRGRPRSDGKRPPRP